MIKQMVLIAMQRRNRKVNLSNKTNWLTPKQSITPAF